MFIVLSFTTAKLRREEDAQALRIGLLLGMYVGATGDSPTLIGLGMDRRYLPLVDKVKMLVSLKTLQSEEHYGHVEEAVQVLKSLLGVKHKNKDQIVMQKKTEVFLDAAFNFMMLNLEQTHNPSGYPGLYPFLAERDLFTMPINTEEPELVQKGPFTVLSHVLNERLLDRGMKEPNGTHYPADTVMEYGIVHRDDEEVYGVVSAFEAYLESAHIAVANLNSSEACGTATVYEGELIRFPVLLTFLHGELKQMRTELEPLTLPLRKSMYQFTDSIYRKPLERVDSVTIQQWFTEEIKPTLKPIEECIKKSKHYQFIENYFENEVYFETKLFVVPYSVLWGYYNHVGLANENSITIATAELPQKEWLDSACIVLQIKGINFPTGIESTYLLEKKNLEI